MCSFCSRFHSQPLETATRQSCYSDPYISAMDNRDYPTYRAPVHTVW